MLTLTALYTDCTHRMYNEVSYCEAIGHKLVWTQTKNIENIVNIQGFERENCVDFSFRLKKNDYYERYDNISFEEYCEKYCGEDINAIIKTIDDYLKNHPEHILNDKYISIIIRGIADDTLVISNYNYIDNTNERTSIDYWDWT